MITVKFYGYLSKITGAKSITTQGSQVQDILRTIFQDYLEIKEEFEDGQINVVADSLSLSFPKDYEKVVEEELSLLPVIEGGLQ